MTPKKVLNLVLGIFATIGIIFMVVAALFCIGDINFRKTAKETNAIITDIESYRTYNSDGKRNTKYDVYVEFDVQGQTYGGVLGYYSSEMREGQVVRVVYQISEPQDFRSPNQGLLFIVIFGSIGIIFFVIAIIVAFCIRIEKKRKNELMNKGKAVEAKVTDIIDGNMRINSSRSKNIICEYKEGLNGKIYIYKSENSFGRMPSKDELEKMPKITVYVDYNNYEKYYVDVESWLSQYNANVIDLT